MNFEDYITNSAKPLPVFLLLDTSGSMLEEGKIATLNQCVKEMIDDFKSERMSEIAIKLCIITFGGDRAEIHTPLTSLSEIKFENLEADGMTPLGDALRKVSNIINDKNQVTSKGYRPVVVLVSDGYPNDEWKTPLEEFINGKRTSKCDNWALGIGSSCDRDMLQKFLGKNGEKEVFDASAAAEIAKFFKLVTFSTVARTKSQDPNSVINLSEIEKQFENDMPNFDFGL